MDETMDDMIRDHIVKQSVRVTLEEVTYAPTKVIFEKEDGGWVKTQVDNYEETYRNELRHEELYEGDSEEAEAIFDDSVFRLKDTYLRKEDLQALAKAIAYGVQTMEDSIPLDGHQVRTMLRNGMSEIAHAMNRETDDRKKLITNDAVDSFVEMLYEELNIR